MELTIPFSSSSPGIGALALLRGEFFVVGTPAAGHTRGWERDEGLPAPLMIQIRGRDLIPFYWGGLPLGWNRDVTVAAENQIRDVMTQITGGRRGIECVELS